MKEKVREAHRLPGRGNVQKQVLCGTKYLPDCTEGPWVSRDWIEEAGGAV